MPSSASWGFPVRWGNPRTEPNENSRVEVDDREDFHRLKDISVLKQSELVTEQALYDAGLSPVPRLGRFFIFLTPFSSFCFFFSALTIYRSFQICHRGHD